MKDQMHVTHTPQHHTKHCMHAPMVDSIIKGRSHACLVRGQLVAFVMFSVFVLSSIHLIIVAVLLSFALICALTWK